MLDGNYRGTNSLLVSEFVDGPVVNLRGKYRSLVDHDLPTTNELKVEGSGVGLLSVFLNQTIAEFTSLISSPADKIFLKGLEDNLFTDCQ